jgi:PAS domain S-box-containing protein
MKLRKRMGMKRQNKHKPGSGSPDMSAKNNLSAGTDKLAAITKEWGSAFDFIQDAVTILDLEGTIVRCNKATSDLLGKPFPEIIGYKCWELMRGTSEPVEGCPIERMKETLQRETLILPIHDRWYKVTADPIFDDAGKLCGAVHIISDITEYIKSEEQYRLAMEATMDGLWDWDIATNKVYYSPMWANILGLEHIEPKFEVWESRIHPDDKSGCLESLQMHLNGETGFWRFEHRLKSETGEWIWVVGRGRVIIWDSNGHAIRMIGITTDISGRKRAEEEVQRLKEFYDTILENVMTGVWVSDRDDVIIYANSGMELIACVVRDRIQGKHVLTGFPEDEIKHFLPFYLQARNTLELVRYYSIPVVTPMGHEAFHSGWLIPQLKDGKYDGMICTVEDVTEHKLAEKELRISEEKYSRLIGNLQRHFLYRHDINGDFIYVSPSITNVLGYTQEDFLTSYTKYLTDDPINEEVIKHTDLSITGQVQPAYEVEIYHKDGSRQWLEVTEAPIFDENGKVIAVEGIAHNITTRRKIEEDMKKMYHEIMVRQHSVLNLTEDLMKEIEERKQIEVQLRESEEKYHLLFEAETDAILVFNGESRQIIDVNSAALHLYGYSYEEFLSLYLMDIAAEPEASEKTFKSALSGHLTKVPLRYHRKKDGTVFPVEISAGTFRLKEQQIMIGTIRDVTEREEIEKRLQDYRDRLSELASQIALMDEDERRRFADELHDVIGQNVALAKIRLAEQIDLTSDAELKDQLTALLQLIGSISESIRSLTFELSPPLLYEIGFEAAAEWFGELILKRHNIAYHFEDDGQTKPLKGETKILLYLSLRELIVNVAKHSRASHATLAIRRENDSIYVRVADDGIGFDTKDMDFLILKAKSFGLFSTSERVKRMGGHLHIVSEPGRGTTVTIETPLDLESQ